MATKLPLPEITESEYIKQTRSNQKRKIASSSGMPMPEMTESEYEAIKKTVPKKRVLPNPNQPFPELQKEGLKYALPALEKLSQIMSIPQNAAQMALVGLHDKYEGRGDTYTPEEKLNAIKGQGLSVGDVYKRKTGGSEIPGGGLSEFAIQTFTDPLAWPGLATGAANIGSRIMRSKLGKKVAAKLGSRLAKVSEGAAARVIERPEGMTRALYEREAVSGNIKDLIDGKMDDLRDAVRRGEKTTEQAQREFDNFVESHVDEVKTKQAAIGEKRAQNIYNLEDEARLAKEERAAIEANLKDSPIGMPTEDEFVKARLGLKQKVGDASKYGKEILEQEGVTVDKEQIKKILDDARSKVQLNIGEEPITIGQEKKEVVGRLESLQSDIDKLPEEIPGYLVEDIIKDIDSSINYNPNQVGFANKKSLAGMRTRAKISKELKSKSPAYALQKQETAKLTSLLNKLQRKGLLNDVEMGGIAPRLSSATRDPRLYNILKETERVTGSKFLDDINELMAQKQQLRDKPSLLAKEKEASEKLIQARRKSPEFISRKDIIEEPMGAVQLSPELERLKQAQEKLGVAEAELSPWQTMTPSATQGKIQGTIGKNIESGRQVRGFGEKYNLGYGDTLDDLTASGEFLKQGGSGSEQGVRNLGRASLNVGAIGDMFSGKFDEALKKAIAGQLLSPEFTFNRLKQLGNKPSIWERAALMPLHSGANWADVGRFYNKKEDKND